jgi:hypothetical protein|tara:strand:+ start:1700 stop:1870 length:171 start_codon:yes stop_codon:yes gene_type:complete
MDSITIFLIWLGILSIMVTLMAICSAYFAWWYITLRNPQITKLIIEAYKESEDKLK